MDKEIYLVKIYKSNPNTGFKYTCHFLKMGDTISETVLKELKRFHNREEILIYTKRKYVKDNIVVKFSGCNMEIFNFENKGERKNV